MRRTETSTRETKFYKLFKHGHLTAYQLFDLKQLSPKKEKKRCCRSDGRAVLLPTRRGAGRGYGVASYTSAHAGTCEGLPLDPVGRNAKTLLTAGDSRQKCLAKSISNEILLISSMPHGANLADWIAVRGLAVLDQIAVNLVIEVQFLVDLFHDTAISN